MTVYPQDDAWGNRTLPACAAHHADGLEDCQVIALCDSWVLEPDPFPDGLRLAVWAPVDHDPLPEISRKVLAHPSVTPIAMSRFGEDRMRRRGLEPLYVPHGIDTALFRPRPDERDRVRDELGVPRDAFLVGMVAANKGSPLASRKSFPQVFQAFAAFRQQRPDALLYVHSNEIADGSGAGGVHLRALANACGLPRRSVRFTDPLVWSLGVRREDVARMFSAFDVLASPSFGEGFGVPLLEAQACGVPVIATDHSAMSELCEAGWLVDGDPWYDAPQDSWFKCPQIKLIRAALELAYEARGDQELREEARAFALSYDADRVLSEHWLPALARLDTERELPLIREYVSA
ncbi:MAG: glycosyltransferase [Actinomycetota bacterium]|nr:glycosyltransferase [Actinomycetota bacterium]